MSEACFKKNDLPIPGTRQDERLAAALQPGYVQPDERSLADLLVFISKYATLLNYYAVINEKQTDYVIEGNWQPLILSDEAFNYAGIAITPHALPNIAFFDCISRYEKGSTEQKRFAAYRVLWDVLFSLYRDINTFYAALPVNMPLRSVVATEITNALVTDMMNAAARYLNIADLVPGVLFNGVNPPPAGQFQMNISTSAADSSYKFGFANDVLNDRFDDIWKSNTLPGTKWYEYKQLLEGLNTEVQYDASKGFVKDFFGDATMSTFDRIDYSTIRLKQLFNRAFEAYTRIIHIAGDYLKNSVTNNSAHQAHHGLLLAFVKLFSLLQQNMNDFTLLHLEYYYCRVLQLQPAPATPDAVHAVLEPAKNAATAFVAKGTALNAGKDDTGVLRLYKTDDEITVNQSVVSQLKTIHAKPATGGTAIEKLFASPIANSADGVGGAFNDDDISWKAFGDERNVATVGFCMASPVLHLTEGVRAVEIFFTVDTASQPAVAGLSTAFLRSAFEIYLSGEKGWERTNNENSEPLVFANVVSGQFKMRLVLKAEFPPVVGYDAAVLGDGLTTHFPAIKMLLNQNEPAAYEKLRGINILAARIEVEASELATLALHNELGILDAAKPVQLFGPTPKKGSAFYIGHPELVHKNFTLLELSLKWLNYDNALKSYYDYYKTASTAGTVNYIGITTNDDFKASVQFIRNKNWQPIFSETTFLNAENKTLTNSAVTNSPVLQTPKEFTITLPEFTSATQNGFLRLTLTKPDKAFGHTDWPTAFAKQTVAFTLNQNNTLPNPPYVPTLAGISLRYKATAHILINNASPGHFFHIMPFGFRRRTGQPAFLPAFTLQHKEVDGTLLFYRTESVMLIGLGRAQAKQHISLLVQMDEGTEDIAIDTPPVVWNYLSINGWRHFGNQWLADNTLGLLKAGIVTFTVPPDANFNATELPAGLLWVAVAVRNNSGGLPKALTVHSNAVKATFANQGNDPQHFSTALPAQTISKLYEPDAAIKKVIQPYASFGGKQKEQGHRFNTRVSERLRHKNRAITIWDYERLVLNQYPEVYMLKCLNHTGYEMDCAQPSIKKYKENLPGSVLLVTVPFITNQQAGNIYQPSLSAGKLTDIKNYITGNGAAIACNKYIPARHCQLATLLVENPAYETITVTCEVKVRECLDKNFYKAQLHTDLNNFLSPWIKGEAGKINFGGSLHISVVVYFMEQLHYIDYVEKATIVHKAKNASGIYVPVNTADLTLANATTSRSILTSSNEHSITAL
jgi:hypothetical protein